MNEKTQKEYLKCARRFIEAGTHTDRLIVVLCSQCPYLLPPMNPATRQLMDSTVLWCLIFPLSRPLSSTLAHPLLSVFLYLLLLRPPPPSTSSFTFLASSRLQTHPCSLAIRLGFSGTRTYDKGQNSS